MKDERGFALVITLLITALLVALSVEFVDEVFVDTSARQNFTDGQQASIMAGSGVDLAIKGLQLSLTGRSYNSLADPWAQPFKEEDETGSLLVTIEDESGKLNLNQIFGPNGNTISQTNYYIADRLLKKLGLSSSDLLDALADWVDNLNVPPHAAGAKNAYYNALKPPYDVKSGALETIEELRLIKGFDAKAMQLLRPYVTVYSDTSNPGAININTAPKEIIAVLDAKMTDSLTNQVLDYRKTTPFQLKTDLGKVPGMDNQISVSLSTSTTAMGTVYRIVSQATVKETTRIVEAVVQTNGQPPILYWREY